jgi:hypothetical protein
MKKSILCVLSVAAIMGAVLTSTAASAAVTANARAAIPAPGDPDTTVTFTVTVGALSMTAPVSANLGAGAPGSTIAGAIGAMTVTDDRALLSAAWAATASSTAFVTGGATPAETVPANRVGYSPGAVTTTGTITSTGTPITLSGAATPVVAGTAGVGDNTATWNPLLSVAVPASAVGGVYAGTLTQSVS